MRRFARICLGIGCGFLLVIIVGVLYLTLGPHKISFKLVPRTTSTFKTGNHPQPTYHGDFEYYTLDGKPRHLAASRGKVVFVNRWGTWCAPCVAEMPSLQKLYNHYKADPDVEFLFIASRDSAVDVRNFAQRRHLDMPLYIEDDTDTSTYEVSTFPSTTIYRKDGSVFLKQTGGADWSDPSAIAQIEMAKLQQGQASK
jgi:thiol-disulfide isomerase/thioredoxin